MPREKDSFREYVEFLQNDRWKCKFCKKDYAGSATRIKAHLAGIGGYGINGCKDVSDRVRLEARKALKGKGVAESSNGGEGNVEEGLHLPVTANNEEAWRETSFAAMPYPSSDVISTLGSSAFPSLPQTNLFSQSLPAQSTIPLRDLSFWPQQPQSHAGDSYTQPHNFSYPISRPDLAPEALINITRPFNAGEEEPNTEVPQDMRTEDAVVISQPSNCGPADENMPSLKRKREEQSNREVVDNCRNCSFRKLSRKHATRCRKIPPLLTTELRGKKSEETIKKICDYLMEDEIVVIGIYGMGGVGKTAILMHVHNKMLENPTFNEVFWVTVPQEFSIYELQDRIADVVGLDNLSKYKDVERRACILDRHLKKKKTSILLLDGMWMHFEVKDVGIPIKKDGLKLVLTTRSLDVCHEMLCQKIIKTVPLKQDDAWSLFKEKLCFGRELPLEVNAIAKSIVDMCGCLPLGIIEIATRMRGVNKVYEWKSMLWKLEESMVELNVYKRLKLSYENLDDSQMQQCFLHLTQQNSRYYDLNKKDLIESFIDEGLLDGISTRQALHERGNAILDKLGKVCLCDVEEQEIYLHPLIKDMALHIARGPAYMVKTCMKLKEIPQGKFWTDRLEKVLLQGNIIEDIPCGISPNCPKLTRLSLNANVFLEAIHESFFMHMRGLKVLNLSETNIMELPNTISHLESLEALLLRECKKLCRLPSIQNLGSLKKLDLSGCAMLGEVPEGMEMLVKLTYLDLLGTEIKTLPEEVLGKLVNLQYLVINYMMDEEVEVELTIVEGLYCSVLNVETFNACVRLVEQNNSQPYDLALSASGNYFFRNKHKRHIIIESCHGIAATVDGEIGGDGCALLPKNVQVLEVGRYGGVTSLCKVGPFNNLEELEIKEWEKLEELGVVHFPRLRRLNITRCTKLKHFLKEGHELRYLQWLKIEGSEELEGINIVAPFLYNIEVYKCPKMKWVVKWQWLATCLPNLRSIKIKNCEQLEEILGGLPIGAPCRLTKIEIEGCNNLKRVLMRHDMLLGLPFLRHLSVKGCRGIDVIIDTVTNMTQPAFLNLTHLTLSNLPELKGICDGTVSCLLIESICLTNCPKLKRLPLLDDGLSYHPPSRRLIWIDRLTWQSLEWDRSVFSPSLENLARIYAREEGVSDQRIVKIDSCDSIAARVDGEIGGDGRNRLPENVQVLEIGGGSGVTSLSEVGPLENLEELSIEEWEKLEDLGDVYFPHLQKLIIAGCIKLKHLSVEGQGLPRLQWLKIVGSEELEGIDLATPSLHHMEVWVCPKMKRAVEWDWLATRLGNLNSIKIYNCEKLEQIIGGGPLPNGPTCLLANIEIEGCNNMKRVLMTHDMLLHLRFLRQIIVKDCKGIEVIIGTTPNMTHPSIAKLTFLTLTNLPALKRICDGTISCLSVEYIDIKNCPNLNKRALLENGLLYPPLSAGGIPIDRLSWQSMEWDQLLFQPPLDYLNNFHEGDSNWDDQRVRICIKSCDSIVAKADGEIHGDGCNLIPKNVQVLIAGGVSGMTSLSEVGSLENLEELTIVEWEKLEELGAVHLPHLQGLSIKNCSKLKHLSVEGQVLPRLQWFKIDVLKELEDINLGAPNLNHIEVSKCPKLERMVEWDRLSTRLPNLKSIGIYDCEKLEHIIGGAPLPIGATCLLENLIIKGCNSMKGLLLTHDMLLHLPFLQRITVENCNGIEVIIGTFPNMMQPSFPKLTHLTLGNLPKLKRICDQMESCHYIQCIKIYNCPKLKRIPLRLHPLDNGLLSPPPSLGQIVADEETWQALEWDHPLAHVSLEPFIEFIE